MPEGPRPVGQASPTEGEPSTREAPAGRRPRVLFLGSTYAGHNTRFLNLERNTRDDPRIRPSYRRVTGWSEHGLIERLPLVPAGVKGRVRAMREAAPLATLPRPDVIWLSSQDVAAPYLWSQWGPLRRPIVLDLDWTLAQQEELAPIYFNRPPKRGARLALARLRQRLLWRSVTLFTPWSNWAADALRREGIPDARIRVLPPGVDLAQWQPRPEPRRSTSDRLRLLFVGGNFVRKGGDLLIELVRTRYADRCELDIVTRDAVSSAANIRIHRAEPNSPLLQDLYARADLFVMPTRAECFGIATIEAMASGLAVIAGDVGGARDIVDEGETGWLIPPTAPALAQALDQAVARAGALPAMGLRARRVAEQRFDARRNDARIADLLVAFSPRGFTQHEVDHQPAAHTALPASPLEIDA